VIRGVVRSGLNKFFPNFVDPDPQAIIGMPDHTLSHVYDMAVGQGIIGRHREINTRTRQDFFERQTGMVTVKKGKEKSLVSLAMCLAFAVIIPAAIIQKVM
jgi:hypothetical protein